MTTHATGLLAEADRLHAAGALPQATAGYRAALAQEPGLFDAWYGLAHAEAAQGIHAAAIEAFTAALDLRPGAARLRVGLGSSLFALGHVGAAMAAFGLAARSDDAEARVMALANMAMAAPGDPALGNAAILGLRRRWVAEAARALPRLTPRGGGGGGGGRLRVAYTGAFWSRPNWMKMYMGTINAHDRARFEIHIIADHGLPTAEAGYVEHPDDALWDVTGMPDDALAEAIAAAGIDILVDTNGYSHPARLNLLMRRAAPVQVAWNGMYATTGIADADILVGDAWAIPPEEDAFCVERVRRVPGTYLAFHVFHPAPDVAPPPCLAAGRVTFGSLNSAYKLTDTTLAAWAEVLRAVPGASLLLRNRALDHAANRAHLAARFATLGIDAGRLVLEGGGSNADFLATYARIDIALDTFPYNGGTTTAEALWQGVPVVTTNGDRWAGRTSRSLLMAAGLGADVAADAAGFVARARALAADPAALAARRATQRATLAASPACDTAALCRALEAIYLEAAGQG